MNTEDSEFQRIEREQAMRKVPDAITDDSESPEYRTGWNECRAAMLAEQPAPAAQQERRPLDLAAAIEYADARWAGVDVPAEWCRHFADALQPAQTARAFVGLTNAQWQAIVDDDRLDNIGAIKKAIEATLRENNPCEK